MNLIKLLLVIGAIGYYRWAMKEINKTHPDVPKIRLRQVALEDHYRRLTKHWRNHA